jgi:hypothetical protein
MHAFMSESLYFAIPVYRGSRELDFGEFDAPLEEFLERESHEELLMFPMHSTHILMWW